MGTSLRRYPDAITVLEAHVRELGHPGPTAERCVAAATIAQYLTKDTPVRSDEPGLKVCWEQIRLSHLALLEQGDWCDMAREGLDVEDARLTWLADAVAPALKLRAFRVFRNGRPRAGGMAQAGNECSAPVM
ncbi:hypothetical protein OHS70_37725 [Streptomyces sp. NBC_00390]|uniref:hypothetical protein n=1 Tax=Streptomyces sp. NBC_00390 TaxID=2975736 RepID=UPI002E2159C8